jgi:enhancing lycopene biosynthesis protein 2
LTMLHSCPYNMKRVSELSHPSNSFSQGDTMSKRNFAVILSGCGHQDGAEIHESTLTLWAIHKHGADYQCFAPDIPQYHVLNHITGEEMNDKRNVLIESARIARGNISELTTFKTDKFDALILPGGFGAAKNLSNYAFNGADCEVEDSVAQAITAMHAAGKPIGALCISPVLLARTLEKTKLTIGQDPATIANIEKMGASHECTYEGEIVVDTDNRIVTTPCYMLDSRVDKIAAGADRLVAALLRMME